MKLNDEQVYGNFYLHVTILQRERNNESSPEMCSLAPELIVSDSPYYSSSLQGLGTEYITALCTEAHPNITALTQHWEDKCRSDCLVIFLVRLLTLMSGAVLYCKQHSPLHDSQYAPAAHELKLM